MPIITAAHAVYEICLRTVGRISCFSELNRSMKSEKLREQYPKIELVKILNNKSAEDWFRYLREVRNRVQHGFTLSYDIRKKERRVLLADNPRMMLLEEVTTDRNYEVLPWCKKLYHETSELIEVCCKEINRTFFS